MRCGNERLARLPARDGIKVSGDRRGQAKLIAQNKKQCGLFQFQGRDIFLGNSWS